MQRWNKGGISYQRIMSLLIIQDDLIKIDLKEILFMKKHFDV